MELAGQDLRQNPDFAAIINVEGQFPMKEHALEKLKLFRASVFLTMNVGTTYPMFDILPGALPHIKCACLLLMDGNLVLHCSTEKNSDEERGE